MKALVTGATGFIGSHLVEELLGAGYEVNIMKRHTSSLAFLPTKKIGYFDYSGRDSLRGKLSGYDYIFHLAGKTKCKSKKEYYESNETLTLELLDEIKEACSSGSGTSTSYGIHWWGTG